VDDQKVGQESERRVKAEGVDFYLVDLPDAKLDSTLREQALATGAIFEDAIG
jgi:hypothetical protein